ncbi:MAG: hypothetical protein V4819_17785 [Verrucomicrobiota bacterium]
MLKKALIAFACAALAGGVIGWSRTDKKPPARPVTIQAPAPVPPAPRPKWTAGDFLKFARDQTLAAKQPGFNPLSERLTDWSDGEIVAALNACLTDPGFAFGSLDDFLLGEWMKRDFDAAIAWFDKLESRSVKSRLASALSHQWPADKAEQGLAFVRANRDIYPGPTAWSIMTKVFDNRVKQGPAALEDLLRVAREEKLEFGGGSPGSLPTHFDFAAFAKGEEFEKLWESGQANLLMLAWHAQDRGEAFDWLLENHGAKSLSAIARLPDGDTPGNLKWMGRKFETLDPDQRQEFLDEMQLGWAVFPTLLVTFSQGISDPAVMDEARRMGVQGIFAGKIQEAMPLIESIKDPARRIEILEQAEPSAVFDTRPDLRRFDAFNESQLRAKLTEWHATKSQIKSILARFKL